MFAYQLTVNPRGGKTTIGQREKELTTTGTNGDTKKISIPMVKTIDKMRLVLLCLTDSVQSGVDTYSLSR